MNGIRCQLCDGVISNGRCKVCGMPYRNDEVLYHLNENRRDHYKHATPKAQEIMRQSMVPQGDKSSSGSIQNRSLKNGSWSGSASQGKTAQSRTTQTSDRLMTKDQIRAQQEKVRQEAMAKINTTKVPNRNNGTDKRNKKKGISWIWWIVVIFYIIVGAILK